MSNQSYIAFQNSTENYEFAEILLSKFHMKKKSSIPQSVSVVFPNILIIFFSLPLISSAGGWRGQGPGSAGHRAGTDRLPCSPARSGNGKRHGCPFPLLPFHILFPPTTALLISSSTDGPLSLRTAPTKMTLLQLKNHLARSSVTCRYVEGQLTVSLPLYPCIVCFFPFFFFKKKCDMVVVDVFLQSGRFEGFSQGFNFGSNFCREIGFREMD